MLGLNERHLVNVCHVCRQDALPKVSKQHKQKENDSADDSRRRGKRVNHGNATLRNERASRCRHCCASSATEAIGSDYSECISGQTTPGLHGDYLVIVKSPLTAKITDSEAVASFTTNLVTIFAVFSAANANDTA